MPPLSKGGAVAHKNSGDYWRDCYITKPFQNRTIPLTFRNANICLCFLVFHLNYPSPRTITLASLVKGRWIDGTTQTVALLLSACDMSTLFILQTLLPSRRRDCYPSAPSFQNRTIPRKSPTPLPFNKRFAGFTKCSKSPTPLPLNERSVGFASLRNFGRSTSGIHARPLSKVRCCRPQKFGQLSEGLLPIRTNPPKTSPSLKNRHHHCLLMNALLFHIRTIPLAFRRGGARSSRCIGPCCFR